MNKTREKIQNWFITHEPAETMKYKETWWKNNMFIRDRIMELFNENAEVIGTHYSKSIECPVIKTTYREVEILWQYNFYHWQIMVKSKYDLELNNLDLCNATGDYLFYQGIPDDYQFKSYNTENTKEFAISINHDRLDVWAFALELKKAIDNRYTTYRIAHEFWNRDIAKKYNEV